MRIAETVAEWVSNLTSSNASLSMLHVHIYPFFQNLFCLSGSFL